MTFGRTSAFIYAAAVLFGFIPGVAADCWIDSSGYEVCDGMNFTIRIIIGISISIVCIVILSLIGYRRRRAAQANIVYLQQAPQGRGGMNESPYGLNGGPPSAPPPYPVQTYDHVSLTTVVVRPAVSPP